MVYRAQAATSRRMRPSGRARAHRLDVDALVADLDRFAKDGTVPPPRPAAPAPGGGAPKQALKPGIKRIVAIMSGKGGVGKSLVTGLLAVALQRLGLRVGILDADITGPSMARLFGVCARPFEGPDGKPHPPVDEHRHRDHLDEPAHGEGPMRSSGADRWCRERSSQFYTDLEWGTLDYLLIDLPPGTSDAPLTVLASAADVGRRARDDTAGSRDDDREQSDQARPTAPRADLGDRREHVVLSRSRDRKTLRSFRDLARASSSWWRAAPRCSPSYRSIPLSPSYATAAASRNIIRPTTTLSRPTSKTSRLECRGDWQVAPSSHHMTIATVRMSFER